MQLPMRDLDFLNLIYVFIWAHSHSQQPLGYAFAGFEWEHKTESDRMSLPANAPDLISNE